MKNQSQTTDAAVCSMKRLKRIVIRCGEYDLEQWKILERYPPIPKYGRKSFSQAVREILNDTAGKLREEDALHA